MRSGITPPAVKYEISAYNEIHDITPDMFNWKDLETEDERDDLSGVFELITAPFEFRLKAYDIVKAIFDQYGVRAEAKVLVSLRNNQWTYEAPTVFDLDFLTYERHDDLISIHSRKSTLFEMLKSKRNAKFDIPVSEVAEINKWNFTRIEVENNIAILATSDIFPGRPGGYIDAGWENDGTYNRFARVTIGTSWVNSEISATERLETPESVGTFLVFNPDRWFLAPYEKVTNLNVGLTFNITQAYITIGTDSLGANQSQTAQIRIGLFKNENIFLAGQTHHRLISDSLATGINIDKLWTTSINAVVSSGDKLYFGIEVRLNSSSNALKIYFSRITFEGSITASYNSTNDPVSIDVIQPQKLLQNLVNRITHPVVYNCSIPELNTNSGDLDMICAAESIRGILDARIHTSYDDFKSWMMVFGFEPYITESSLVFKKRNGLFLSDTTALVLAENEVAGLIEKVNSDLLFSTLKIGYKRNEYSNKNGRYEFNGTHDYISGIVGSNNIMEFISPYRADGYGIEFLCHERGRNTTDNKSDNDIFIVNLKTGTNVFETRLPSVLSGNTPNQTLFNVKYNPKNLVDRNKSLFGISTDILVFTGSDMNSGLIIDGGTISGDVNITERLFSPMLIDVASANIVNLPAGNKKNGLVRFSYKGTIYEGYIKKISKNYAWESETTWELYKK